MPRHHVTNKEAQAVADFACDVITTLHLPGWQVLVMEDPAEDDCLASISPMDTKYVAQLYLCSDWMKRSDEERRETIVHEVLHLLHFRIDHVFEDAGDFMHGHEHRQLERRYERETELMVDHLAKFLSRTHCLEDAWKKVHGR